MHKQVLINYESFDSLIELSDTEKELSLQSMSAAKKAYAPYSKFKVGVSLLLDNGKVITANNQEMAAYPSGLCAERVGVFYANANYPNIPVVLICISAFMNDSLVEEAITPCGACRQVLMEYEAKSSKAMKTILIGKKNIMAFDSIRKLMPFAFDAVKS